MSNSGRGATAQGDNSNISSFDLFDDGMDLLFSNMNTIYNKNHPMRLLLKWEARDLEDNVVDSFQLLSKRKHILR
jgi:hypothetical protein